MRLALVVALVALTGCGTIRALAGPDPALVTAAPAIHAALGRDSEAHPEVKPQNDAASGALDVALNPPLPPIPPVPGLPWLPLVGPVLVGAIGLAHSLFSKRAGDAAHDENVARLDAIEAKVAPKPPTP